MKIKPLKDKLLIQLKESEAKTASGLYIPDTAKEKTKEGIVLAIGADVKDVKVDDKVLFDGYGGVEIKLDNKNCIILEGKDIMAVVE